MCVCERERKTWKEKWAGGKGETCKARNVTLPLFYRTVALKARSSFETAEIKEYDFFY